MDLYGTNPRVIALGEVIYPCMVILDEWVCMFLTCDTPWGTHLKGKN